jgi:hypothetical protein
VGLHARGRYLGSEGDINQVHQCFADYFTGRWADNQKKPYTDKSTNRKQMADRYVVTQVHLRTCHSCPETPVRYCIDISVTILPIRLYPCLLLDFKPCHLGLQ